MSRGERGLSESVQWAVLVPLVLLCLVGVVQAGVWWNARIVARQAAAAGADTAAFAGAGPARDAALGVVQQGTLEQTTVTVIDRGTAWEVVVTGRAPVFLDLGMAGVQGSAVAAKEEQ